MTSAFIIEVHPQLQPDSNEETAALLRVLLYKLDNTTFGGNIPTVTEWTGPPYASVQVQILLYASLSVTLFSAFLATLGKQWLNQYESAGVQGTMIDCDQNRQRKLNGIVSWYFNHVMESLPLMLQAALLFLGCALSRFLWDIDPSIASVTLGITSFGLLFYLFILFAGAAFPSCPYQTPGANVLRKIFHININHTFRHIISILHSGFSVIVKYSISYSIIFAKWSWLSRLKSPVSRTIVQIVSLLLLPLTTTIDMLCLMVAMILAPMCLAFRKYSQSIDTHLIQEFDAVPELECISWILQSTTDGATEEYTLLYFAMLMAIFDDDPFITVKGFKILFDYIKAIKENKQRQIDQLLKASVFATTFSMKQIVHMDPTSPFLADMRKHYIKIFPSTANLEGSPYYYSVGSVYNILYPGQNHSWLDWRNCKLEYPHSDIATNFRDLAHLKYQRQEKVPCWILRFVLYSLSLDPPPATLDVYKYVAIVASDLGSDASHGTGWYVNALCILTLLTKNQHRYG